MGMTDNQLHMVKAPAENRIQDAKKCAIACCAEDTTKKNAPYVRRYQSLLENRGQELPYNLTGLLSMEDVSSFREDRYYQGKTEKETLEKIMQADRVSLRLQEMGIRYLNSTLLSGIPGTGKTMFARYAAYRLGVPLAYVNFSYLIDSHMGDTAKNLRRVLDYCKGVRCVLMMDEIDCIGMKRSGDGSGAAGEIARTTITLMQELDQLTNDQILIAATNRADRLDPALKRRFYQTAEFKPFGKEDRMAAIIRFLDHVPGIRYDEKEIENYASEEHTQADLMKFATQIVIREIEKQV